MLFDLPTTSVVYSTFCNSAKLLPIAVRVPPTSEYQRRLLRSLSILVHLSGMLALCHLSFWPRGLAIAMIFVESKSFFSSSLNTEGAFCLVLNLLFRGPPFFPSLPPQKAVVKIKAIASSSSFPFHPLGGIERRGVAKVGKGGGGRRGGAFCIRREKVQNGGFLLPSPPSSARRGGSPHLSSFLSCFPPPPPRLQRAKLGTEFAGASMNSSRLWEACGGLS